MKQTVEAVVSEEGKVTLVQPLRLKGTHRALVLILDEASNNATDTAKLAEVSLAADWNRHEEDEAWSHLQ